MRRSLAAIAAVALIGTLVTSPALVTAQADDLPDTTETTSAVGVAPSPLVVILDVSSSMNDSVGSIVKLQAAKTSLEPTIRSQPPGAALGIWTYPDDGGCGAGRYLVPVSSTHDVGKVIADVDGLSADGSTPTAAAISAVVASLTAQNIDSANLVLVSDGLSNCGDDPCVVATSLAGSGFDLTIQSVGFDISTDGRAELECIAAATGGHYFDVSNEEDLGNVMKELSTPQLTLTVKGSTKPLAGEATAITATVTNPSSIDAIDVRANLAFADAGDGSLFPGVTPPTYKVGNIPAGESVTRTWTVIAGVRGEQRPAAYRVTAWANDTPAVQVQRTFTTSTTGYSTADLGDVLDGITAKGRSLVIMGDSYSSGEGAGNYLPGTDAAVSGCDRSPKTYLAPALTASTVRAEIIACSGAVSADITGVDVDGDGSFRAASQLSQLRSLGSVPGAVVLTLGGNDVNFAEIVTSCVTWAPGAPACTDDPKLVASRLGAVAGLRVPLTAAYKRIWLELNSPDRLAQRKGDFAPVVVLAYPQIAHEYRFGPCEPLNTAETKFANEMVMALDAEIKASVAAVRAEGYEVYFDETTHYAVLPNHTSCEKGDEAWINQIVNLGLLPGKEQSYHPKASGYSAETNSILAWSGSAARIPASAAVKSDARAGRSPFNDVIAGVYDAVRPVVPVSFDSSTGATAEPGQQLAFTASGYMPGEAVTVLLHSVPMTLGTFVADKNGDVRGVVEIPDYAAVGQHELSVSGADPEGSLLEQAVPVSVVPEVPWWLRTVLGASVLCLAGGGILLLRLRRRKRSATAGRE